MSVTCTDELVEQVGTLVKLGVPPMVAARAKGVPEDDYVEWMRRGAINAQGDWRYAKFYDAVKDNEAEAETLLVGKIRSAATDGNWQAASWLLERLWPERYVKRSVNDPNSDPGTRGQPDPFAGVDKVVPLRKNG